MIGTMTPPEAIAVLSLLMVGADNEIKQEELTSMFANPFFTDHVSEKIGPHPAFLKKYNEARKELGVRRLELYALKSMRNAFPALQIKTVALLTLIADADGDFDQKEKELVARVATELGVSAQEVEPELAKMKTAIQQQLEEAAAKAEAEKQQENEEQVDNKSPEES